MFRFQKGLSRTDFLARVGNIQQVADVRKFVMEDGKAQGIKAYGVKTGGGLEFEVLEGKCLDISSMSYNGVNISFLAKPGLVASGYFSPRGSEFQRCFQGGLLYTCGLSNVGSACSENGVDYGIHGRIAHTPASGVSVKKEWSKDEYLMEISGEMREAALFGENLVLKRRICTKMGEKSVKIIDEVENQGFEEQALMILYHFNLGYPLLDKDARLLISAVDTVPKDGEAEKGMDKYTEFCSPVDGFREQVFYHTPARDENGKTFVALINDTLGMGFYIKYDTEQLPRLIQWKSMASGDYVLGLEPSNCRVEGRAKEREAGTLESIKPFERKQFELEIGILDGLEEIKAFEAGVKSLADKKVLK